MKGALASRPLAPGKDRAPQWMGLDLAKGGDQTFIAVAMPQGDRVTGTPGPLVMLCERETRWLTTQRFLSPGDAEELAGQLLAALGALRLGATYKAEAAESRAPDTPAAESCRTCGQDRTTRCTYAGCPMPEAPLR